MHAGPVLEIVTALLTISVKAGWIDPETKETKTVSYHEEDTRNFRLVMSDEFNVEGRTFKDGDDPKWTAIDHSDDAMTSLNQGALQFYNSSFAGTMNGYLNITTVSDYTRWRGWNPYQRQYVTLEKQYKSAMVMSWMKFCFTGGIIEARLKLPGKKDVPGFWPAFWLFGNLGKATYMPSTNLMWPWSYDVCDRDNQNAQEISACAETTHYGLQRHKGRGATEIDVLEVMAGTSTTEEKRPYFSSTLQVSPGIPDHRPTNGKAITSKDKWYKGLTYGNKTYLNNQFYGTLMAKTLKQEPTTRSEKQVYQADALSAATSLNFTDWDDWLTLRLEWNPGRNGSLRWYLEGEFLYEIKGSSLEFMKSQIPVEPSYVIFNTAVSSSWGFPSPCPEGCSCECFDCQKPECHCAIPPGFCQSLPGFYLVDWVRVYQAEGDDSQYLGCDPPQMPTRRFIEGHKFRYLGSHQYRLQEKVKQGGGRCRSNDDCHVSECLRARCRCIEGYTGPHCKALDGHDDEPSAWSLVDPLSFSTLYAPPLLVLIGISLSGMFIFTLLFIFRQRVRTRTQRVDLYP